jgi:hypothetical protein
MKRRMWVKALTGRGTGGGTIGVCFEHPARAIAPRRFVVVFAMLDHGVFRFAGKRVGAVDFDFHPGRIGLRREFETGDGDFTTDGTTELDCHGHGLLVMKMVGGIDCSIHPCHGKRPKPPIARRPKLPVSRIFGRAGTGSWPPSPCLAAQGV